MATTTAKYPGVLIYSSTIREIEIGVFYILALTVKPSPWMQEKRLQKPPPRTFIMENWDVSVSYPMNIQFV